MKFDLGQVLSSTWKIGWNYKVLWLWQMTPGLLGIVFLPILMLTSPAFSMFMGNASSLYFDTSPMRTAYFLISILYSISSAFLNVLAQMTTTIGAVEMERGITKSGFIELFNKAKPYYWRVLGVYAIFFGAILVIWIGFMAGFMVTMGLLLIPFFILFIPLLLIGYSVIELAQNEIIVDNTGMLDSISRGWKLFKENWLGIIIVLLILYFAIYFLWTIVSIPLMLPMMMIPAIFASAEAPGTITSILFIFIFSLIFIGMFVVQGIFMTFLQTSWTVLYMRISGNKNLPISPESVS